MTVSDEDLMAYTDDALPEAERARVAAAVMADPELRARLDAFTQTASLAREAMPLKDVPDALLARVQATIEADAQGGSDTSKDDPVVELPPRPRMGAGLRFAAIAASLVVGFGLGAVLTNPGADGPGAFDLGAVAPALNSAASGETVTAEGIETRLIASFEAEDGAFCREFEARLPDRPDLIGVGCQTNDQWELRFAVATELPESGQFVPAGALDLLEDWLRDTGAGPVLSAEDEAARLSAISR